MLVARAAILFWGNERREDCDIPKEFWWAGGQAALKQDWRAGDFETWIDQRIHCRAYGVLFREADIDAIVPRPCPSPPSRPMNFATSHDCVNQLAEGAGIDPPEAAQRIARHCAASLIASRCSRMWWRTTDRYENEHEDELEGDVPDWFWEDCADHPDTIFDWRTGKISARTFTEDGPRKIILEGLQFDVGGVVALERMINAERDSGNLSKADDRPAVRAGRKRDAEKWDLWIAELAAHIHETGIPAGTAAQGQDELIAAIETRLAERGLPTLGRTTVQSAARAVLLRLRSAGNGNTG